ncbi:uncharacterized protein ACIB01_011696 isoform 2-T2 [Guaruba guarouba]
MSNAWLACRWGNQSHGHQRETFPSGMAPLPGRAPKQRHAGPRGQPVAELLPVLETLEGGLLKARGVYPALFRLCSACDFCHSSVGDGK